MRVSPLVETPFGHTVRHLIDACVGNEGPNRFQFKIIEVKESCQLPEQIKWLSKPFGTLFSIPWICSSDSALFSSEYFVLQNELG